MGSSPTNPGQGYTGQTGNDQSQLVLDTSDDLDSLVSIPTPPPPPPRLTTTNLPPAANFDRKDGFFGLGSTSPPKRQSPLRQSLSHIDFPDSSQGSPVIVHVHKPRFTTRPSRVKQEVAEKKSEGRFDKSKPSDPSTTQQPLRPTGHIRRRSLFSPIEFRHPSAVYDTPVAWHSPSSPDKLRFSSPSGSSPFSFLSSKMAAIKSLGSTPVSVPANDELMNLDIESSLFPKGSPADGETFSPAAFMNLQITASGLLKKFQTAYQHQAILIHELKAEKEAQDDEKAESDVRTRHLKLQLEDMARKASETEAVMQALMEELNKEKRMRLEHRKSIIQSEGSINEDLCVEEDQRRRTWRRSGETAKSDFSFETDEDSIEEASLFSRSRSPTLAPSIISELGPTEAPVPLVLSKPVMPPPPRPIRTSQPQMTTFQKLFKGISGEGDGRGSNGCRNCQGQDASMAWDTVSLLRVENKGLKQRVGELEAVVEEVLDVVNGVAREADEAVHHI
ncbi:hypothetical protein PT974_10692 [Cladobotryum mycophilum]|uniref:Uncharacterized protein n=1 Tax=Cladobotryum mycophilum TaxID=491253 RepID=A0ABR0SBK6_9HYPO